MVRCPQCGYDPYDDHSEHLKLEHELKKELAASKAEILRLEALMCWREDEDMSRIYEDPGFAAKWGEVRAVINRHKERKS